MNTETTTVDRLVRRVDRLERQNRRLKYVVLGIALAAGGGAAAQVARGAAAAVAGDRFTLVDSADRTTATLENRVGGGGAGSPSKPVLTFFDKDGKARLRLGMGARGPMMEVTDERGQIHDYLGSFTLRPATQ